METVKMGKVYVEINGVITNIADLPREQYETFLELMFALRMAYISVTTRPE